MWNQQFDLTDDQLQMSSATPEGDFRTLLPDFALADLRRTREAAVSNKLIRRAFRSGDRGCLLFWLTGGVEDGVQDKHQLLAYPFSSEAVGWAARRVVRWFDYQRLDDALLLRILEEEIGKREAALEVVERCPREPALALA